MTGTTPTSTGTAGRRRDPAREAQILQATLDVLAETDYADVTIEMVAARAGAGRHTIYRRWAGKDELILAAIACVDSSDLGADALADTGALRSDLLALLDPGWLGSGERRLRILSSVSAMMSRSPEALVAVREAIIEPSTAAYRVLIERAVARGEYAQPDSIEALAQVIPSMLTYRALFLQQSVDEEFVLSMVDGVLLAALRDGNR
ncbi:TetR/AcrR family transcriptional regulator [Kineosporia succinea]|uniref:AcrR family transcriptional regulator n=1 Tax=Kineosporia succinea TaxID=84632 RepID=A0ABT9PCE3_9ACTN|nr:TetR/AcrR family transcriptional regulator [Kineosporia succinea]MDP9830376.1 AcrR family transcriptional regulator [Kineosporia succinea]